MQWFTYVELSFISGEKNVSDGVSSRDGQAAQATSSQQLQQHDTVETFRQKYLRSGKFIINFHLFLRRLCFNCYRAAQIKD